MICSLSKLENGNKIMGPYKYNGDSLGQQEWESDGDSLVQFILHSIKLGKMQ